MEEITEMFAQGLNEDIILTPQDYGSLEEARDAAVSSMKLNNRRAEKKKHDG